MILFLFECYIWELVPTIFNDEAVSLQTMIAEYFFFFFALPDCSLSHFAKDFRDITNIFEDRAEDKFYRNLIIWVSISYEIFLKNQKELHIC